MGEIVSGNKAPKVMWQNDIEELRLIAVPPSGYPYDTKFVFESFKKDTLGSPSWRVVETITDANSPMWKFIKDFYVHSEEKDKRDEGV
jgi:hypothetical protein